MIGQTLGHYLIIEKIGAGGMGEVFRARDERLERDVAVKVLPAGTLSDESARRQFRKEALVLSKLNHPHIATVHDFDTAGGVDFLVMEFVTGETLARKIASGPLSEKETLKLGIQLAEGLTAAHAQGIVHGDLKPRNLIVAVDGRLKILDFGLARQVHAPTETDATQTIAEKREVAGTVPYMSPEQLNGERLDVRSDIYSAGAVLYEMATGRRPFDDESSARLIDAILHQAPVTPRALNARVSPELERIILKSLDKAPERRFQSARELQVDLERLATPSSVTIVAPPAKKPFPRTLIFAVLGVAILLAAALIWRGANRKVAAPVAAAKEITVAVLPFQNMGANPQIDYLRLAIPDEIVTTLSYVPSIAIRPSASTQKYAAAGVDPQQAGRELHVEDIVTGHYQEEGDHLRVTIEAIRVEENRLAWQATVEVSRADLVALQEQIRSHIRQGLVPLLGAVAAASGTRATNGQAYALYLRSIAIPHDPEPNKEGVAMLEQAVALDPGYAPAWAALAHRYDYEAEYGDGGEAAYKSAELADQRALTLDPDFVAPAAHLIDLEATNQQLNSAYDHARNLLKRRPDSATAHFSMSYVLRYAGLFEESARECDSALALDPSDYSFRSCSLPLLLLGRFDRAKDFIRLDSGSQWSNTALFEVLLRQGKIEDAKQLMPKSDMTSHYNSYFNPSCFSHTPTPEGRQRAIKSQKWMLAGRDPEPQYLVAARIADCGYPDLAVPLLQSAVDHNYCSYPALDTDSLLASVRSRPEFAAIRAAGIACQNRFLAHRSQSPAANLAPSDSSGPRGALSPPMIETARKEDDPTRDDLVLTQRKR